MNTDEVRKMLDALEEENEEITERLIDYIHIYHDYESAAYYIMKLTKCNKSTADAIVADCIPDDEPTIQPSNIPKCPTCGSPNLKKISATSKAVNTIAFGLLGTKRHKTFHCNNCGYEW